MSLLRRVKFCLIRLSWFEVVSSIEEHDLMHWTMGYTPEQLKEQTTMQSTPSKAFCKDMVKFLQHLEQYLSKSVVVKICITLDGLPDVEHPDQLGIANRYIDPHTEEFERDPHIFHEPTISALVWNEGISWANCGGLSVHYTMFTTELCTLAENAQRNIPEDLAPLPGVSGGIMSQASQRTVPCLLWSLRPTQDPVNYLGFRPELLGHMDFEDTLLWDYKSALSDPEDDSSDE